RGRQLREPRRAPPEARSPRARPAPRLRARSAPQPRPGVEAPRERVDDRGREAGHDAVRRSRAHDAAPQMIEGAVAAYEKDPTHWLRKLLPHEWIRAAMKELRAAEAAYHANQAKAGLAGCRRAAGMALNAALIVEPNEAWKRTYVEHLVAVAHDETV